MARAGQHFPKEDEDELLHPTFDNQSEHGRPVFPVVHLTFYKVEPDDEHFPDDWAADELLMLGVE